MNIRALSLLLAGGILTSCATPGGASQSPRNARSNSAPFYVLKQRKEGLVLERMEVLEGEPKSLVISRESGIIDVVFPVGPGTSGSAAILSQDHKVELRFEKGLLSVRHFLQGKQIDLPARSLAELENEDVYLCAAAIGSRPQAFRLSGYKNPSVIASGLLLDLFGGKIPANESMIPITTSTRTLSEFRGPTGSAPINLGRYILVKGHLGQREGWFVVDFGAGVTAVAKSSLPPDQQLDDAGMLQFGEGGIKELKYDMGGATGAAGPLGSTSATLKFGGIDFGNRALLVMSSLPKVDGREVLGIVGLDVLGCSGTVKLDFGPTPTLSFGNESPNTGGLELTEVNGHLFIPAKVGGEVVQMLLDTGAPVTILDVKSVPALKVKVAGGGKELSGIGGQGVKSQQLAPFGVRLGDAAMVEMEGRQADLPFFGQYRVGDQKVGILGLSTLAGAKGLTVDLRTGRIWIEI